MRAIVIVKTRTRLSVRLPRALGSTSRLKGSSDRRSLGPCVHVFSTATRLVPHLRGRIIAIAIVVAAAAAVNMPLSDVMTSSIAQTDTIIVVLSLPPSSECCMGKSRRPVAYHRSNRVCDTAVGQKSKRVCGYIVEGKRHVRNKFMTWFVFFEDFNIVTFRRTELCWTRVVRKQIEWQTKENRTLKRYARLCMPCTSRGVSKANLLIVFLLHQTN